MPLVTDETTLSGYPARAVAGYPADSILYALSEGILDQPPHLVVTGLNEGQNMGPVVLLSGTVGAARTAVRQGVPALATSQQLAESPDYATGARYVVEWVEANRSAILAGELVVQTYDMNVPSCPEGEPRGVVEVPVLADLGERNYVAPSDCVSDLEAPENDLDALQRGWVSLSVIAPD
jgi:5'-nucleotidase